MALLWAYRTALTLIMLAGLFLSGCGSNQVIVQGDFPTPLIEKLDQTLGVYYEHPEWFEKFFSKLDEKGIDHIKMESRNTSFDPGESKINIGVDVMFNRMSPSAFNRGNENSIFYTLNYLKYLESLGIEIINGQLQYMQ